MCFIVVLMVAVFRVELFSDRACGLYLQQACSYLWFIVFMDIYILIEKNVTFKCCVYDCLKVLPWIIRRHQAKQSIVDLLGLNYLYLWMAGFVIRKISKCSSWFGLCCTNQHYLYTTIIGCNWTWFLSATGWDGWNVSNIYCLLVTKHLYLTLTNREDDNCRQMQLATALFQNLSWDLLPKIY